MAKSELENKAAAHTSYFTPEQSPPAGTALSVKGDGDQKIPKLFQPLKIRAITLQNRIMVSPMCQYSAENGHHTPWHLTHLGGIIQRGPGLTFVEATSVTPQGRITPEDSGLWQDSQIEPLRKTVEFAHSQNQLIAIQLGHAGRKASTAAPWLSAGDVVGKELHGWPDEVYAPSAIPYNEKHATPKAMTIDDITSFKQAFKASVERAVKAGFDVVEIHAAHGYLLHSFLSPATNKRTDAYGGSFENRIRLVVDLVDITRAAIPDSMPLFLRISASDWLEKTKIQGWTVDDSIKLAEVVASKGVDLIDVSSAGIVPDQQVETGPAYQAPFAIAIKKALGDKVLVTSVGSITEGKQANGLLEKDGLDGVMAGRMFQKNPGLVWAWADDLGLEGRWANQIRWGFGGRGKK